MREQKGTRELALFRWGLIPSWAKDPAIGNRMINARSETVANKPSFRSAFRRRRCLVPADGFYEWGKIGGAKQPFFIHMQEESPFAIAGLWEHWQDSEGNEIETCTLLTTEANALLATIHKRMPVILNPGDYARWLDPDSSDPVALHNLLMPYPADAMAFRAVSLHVNNPRNEGPACQEPAQ
jgi:putative SOS response-associated peptidase YedK